MDATPILKIFRMVAPEYGGTIDETVTEWIELCAPLVSKKRFNKLYNQTLALLTAHRMKLAGVGSPLEDDPLGDIGNIAVGNLLRVAQYSEGETSIGFNANLTQYTQDTNAEYALTQYGIQYLRISKMLMSITSAGERHGRT